MVNICVLLTLNTLTVPPVPSWMIPFELVEMAIGGRRGGGPGGLGPPPPSPGYGAPFPPPPIPKTIINYYNPKRLQHAEHDLASSARSHALLATIQLRAYLKYRKPRPFLAPLVCLAPPLGRCWATSDGPLQ